MLRGPIQLTPALLEPLSRASAWSSAFQVSGGGIGSRAVLGTTPSASAPSPRPSSPGPAPAPLAAPPGVPAAALLHSNGSDSTYRRRQRNFGFCGSAHGPWVLHGPSPSCGFAAQAQPEERSQAQAQASPSGSAGTAAAGPEGGAAPAPLPRPPRDVVYEGPLSSQHKLLKRISITNTLIATAAAPAIVELADNISMVSRYGLAASLVFFGMITTGALHWVAHPYVHELRYTAATGEVRVRTTTLLGRSKWHTFNIDDVRPLPWNRPVATFTAKNQFYYIDVFSFPDPDLLARLVPDAADVPPGYKDDKDEDD
ncbi:hypothetical protein HYH03_010162 [Edaphochlamys debaryana]|uniref:Uncharacterized protein n=1 Tax=Edaphochlamys debaryana TaxID=47281 RepID=A0A835XWQ5_9CHLO|nr:hypothetical protein HYH03_010162 [Edaphochlamys debaryana]|eukprot:KAG2491596.1 hypothetical protein HYH03_010162 [Edaphochlamys debaryana]